MDSHTPLSLRSPEKTPAAPGGHQADVGDHQETASDSVSLEFNPAVWRLDESARGALRKSWSILSGKSDQVLDEFYGFLGQFPETAPHLADRGKVDCLRLLQKEHWQALFAGNFDEDYLARVKRMGGAHARMLVPSRYVVAGYSLVLERMIRSVLQHHRRHPEEAAAEIGSLVRAMLMETHFTTEISNQARHAEQMVAGMQELAESFEHELDQAVEFVRRSATNMEEAAESVLGAAHRVADDSERATAASDEANNNAQAIAAAAGTVSGQGGLGGCNEKTPDIRRSLY